MAHGPRVVFTLFDEVAVKSAMWFGHARQIVGDSDVVPGPAGGPFIVWQLVTANSRPVARSVAGFASLELAISDARRVASLAPQATISLVLDQSNGLRGWVATVDDAAITTCARWYVSDRDCRKAAELAVVALPAAPLASTMHIVRSSGRTVSRPMSTRTEVQSA